MPFFNYNWPTEAPIREGAIWSCVQRTIVTLVNNSGVEIPVGRAVIRPAGTDDEFALPSAAGQFFAGVSVLEQMYEQSLVQGADQFTVIPDNKQGGVITEGEIGVFCETAVTDLSDPVYFRHTANGAGKLELGRFRTDDDSASSTVDQILSNVQWKYITPANSFNVLILNLPT